jgi:hypothetical protein
MDAVAEAIGGLLLDGSLAGVPAGRDSLLQRHPEARVFFINELYPLFLTAWALVAPGVQGWQSLYISMRRAILCCATSYVNGISIFAPSDADGSSPVRRSARLGAVPP